jgi:hypothetical protein
MKKPRQLLLALLGAGLAVVSVTAIATKPAEGGSGVTAEGLRFRRRCGSCCTR